MGYWATVQVSVMNFPYPSPVVIIYNAGPDHGFFLTAGSKLFTECAMQFLLSGPTHRIPVDFSKRNLVGIGHSLGGISV